MHLLRFSRKKDKKDPNARLRWMGTRLGKRDWHPNDSLKGLGLRLGKRNLNPDTLLKGLGFRLGKRDGREYKKHGPTPAFAFQATQYLPWNNVHGLWTKRGGLKFVRLRRQMLSNVRL